MKGRLNVSIPGVVEKTPGSLRPHALFPEIMAVTQEKAGVEKLW